MQLDGPVGKRIEEAYESAVKEDRKGAVFMTNRRNRLLHGDSGRPLTPPHGFGRAALRLSEKRDTTGVGVSLELENAERTKGAVIPLGRISHDDVVPNSGIRDGALGYQKDRVARAFVLDVLREADLIQTDHGGVPPATSIEPAYTPQVLQIDSGM